jgi:hypothetical protein
MSKGKEGIAPMLRPTSSPRTGRSDFVFGSTRPTMRYHQSSVFSI